jgi:hypothetical protein
MMHGVGRAGELLVRAQQPPSNEGDADEPLQAVAQGYAAPFGWWGYHWSPPAPRSLPWLMQQGALDAQVAAFLSLAVEARASLIVVAEPHEAGKTTLLTALIDFLPERIRPIYLRGWYERFTFLNDIPPDAGYMLCNEISAHLPTYLWGHGVRRVFELAAEQGYPLATTMHATCAADAFDQLMRYPLDVPPPHVNAIDLVVTIGVGYANNRLLRRVARIEHVCGDVAPRPVPLATREPLRGDMTYQVGRLIGALASWLGCTDDAAAALLARRARQLAAWCDAGLVGPDAVREAIAGSRRLQG